MLSAILLNNYFRGFLSTLMFTHFLYFYTHNFARMPFAKADINDVEELNQLVNAAYRGDTSRKGWTTEADLLDGSRINAQTIAAYINNSGVTILKYVNDKGQLKACVYLEVKTDKIYLGMLTVSPELQAAGIGRQLLEKAEEFARSRQIYIISMTVISTRAALIAWYMRRGYTATGEVLPFHTGPEFGIPRVPIELMVMEKHLSLPV